MQSLNEIVKGFFVKPKEENTSSVVHQDNVLVKTGDYHDNTGVFFDETNTVFGFSDMQDVIATQKSKILKYRQTAMLPDVDEALDLITNEIIFSYDDKSPLIIQTDIESDSLKEKLQESFSKISKLMNLNRNFYQIVKRGYIDGQINMHCTFVEGNPKKGIQSINMIEPCGLHYDHTTQIWQYAEEVSSGYRSNTHKEVRFSSEELVREDFGLYDGHVNLSYLEYALKSSNMLRTLEDLLIPLRFSRSISRRVFNVDIAELPTKRGEEVMREHQRKFKYKKFYNNETGEVSNQQHITSMVEDYWFANRSGGRGTTVDVLDESGNLGELDDILYFQNKLYRSLKIPTSRTPGSDADNEFDFDSTRTSKEDLQFFMFISRLRMVYTSLFKEILRREIISTSVMRNDEWDKVSEDIRIVFREDNKFIEKMELDTFVKKIDIYAQTQEYHGKLFSVETTLKRIFKFSDEEIADELEKIQKEQKNKLYANFYAKDEEGSW